MFSIVTGIANSQHLSHGPREIISMNKQFRSSNRTTLVDKAFAHDQVGAKFQNHQFQRLVARKRKFEDCDFSYSTFDSSYLRNCVFDSCVFVGCSFENSNLRGSHFSGCKFDYVRFSNTYIEPEILDTECPGQENLQKDFARTLRLNFHQIGDAAAANTAIRIELNATKIHLHKAWRSRESYYRKKYAGLKRVGKFFEWAKFISLDFIWGNGEKPLNLLRSIFLFVLGVAFCDVFTLRDPKLLESYVSAFLQAPEVVLGVVKPADFSGLALVAIAATRYIMFACLVSILIRRWSRR